MEKKDLTIRSPRSSIQKKMIVMTITLIMVSVALFLMIVGFRLSYVRDEIRMSGEESSEEILRNSEVSYWMTNIVHVEGIVSDNGLQINERFGYIGYLLKCLKAQVLAVTDHEELVAILNQFAEEILHEDPDGPDCVVIAFPDGESIVTERSSGADDALSVTASPYDPREEEWYRNAVRSRESDTISGSFLPSDHTECITVSTPVFGSGSGEPVCVIGVSIRAEKILEIVKSSFHEDGIFSVLIDRSGTIRYTLPQEGPFSEADALTREAYAGDEAMQFVLACPIREDSGFAVVTVGGQEYYVFYCSIPNAGWANWYFWIKERLRRME